MIIQSKTDKRNHSSANNGFLFASCCILSDDMSLIVGICDMTDAVIACDGRANNDDGSLLSETSLKTLRLNDHLCIGCTGHTNKIRDVLSAVGVDTPDSPDDRIFWDWEESGLSIQTPPEEARKLLHQAIRSMADKAQKPNIACCVLANRYGRPFVCTWTSGNEWNPHGWEIGGVGGSFNIGECLSSPGSTAHFLRLIDSDAGTAGAEQRFVDAIRFAASDNNYRTINRNVYLRRMSTDFVRSDRLAKLHNS